MNSENFVYWLQGLFEMSDTKTLNETQVQIIKEHLHLVFNGVTPTKIESQPFVKHITVQGSPPLDVKTASLELKQPLISDSIKKLLEELDKAKSSTGGVIGQDAPLSSKTYEPLVGSGRGLVIC